MSADIICLSVLWPLFTQIFHSMTPFFTKSTPNNPFFQNFIVKFQTFGALRAHFKKKKTNNNLLVYSWKGRIFTQIWQTLHRMITFFEKFTLKRSVFLIPHPMSPIFYDFLCFRSPVGTYLSLSYSSVPPPYGASEVNCPCRKVARRLEAIFYSLRSYRVPKWWHHNYFFQWILNTTCRWRMMKNIHSPNLVGISSWGPEIWPLEYLISPNEITVNWPGSNQLGTRPIYTVFLGAN